MNLPPLDYGALPPPPAPVAQAPVPVAPTVPAPRPAPTLPPLPPPPEKMPEPDRQESVSLNAVRRAQKVYVAEARKEMRDKAAPIKKAPSESRWGKA